MRVEQDHELLIASVTTLIRWETTAGTWIIPATQVAIAVGCNGLRRKCRTLGGFTTCTATSGSGAQTGMRPPCQEALTLRGPLLDTNGCFGEATGSTTHHVAAQHAVRFFEPHIVAIRISACGSYVRSQDHETSASTTDRVIFTVTSGHGCPAPLGKSADYSASSGSMKSQRISLQRALSRRSSSLIAVTRPRVSSDSSSRTFAATRTSPGPCWIVMTLSTP